MNIDFFKNRSIIIISIIAVLVVTGNIVFYINVSNNLKTAKAEANNIQIELKKSENITQTSDELQQQAKLLKYKFSNLCALFPKEVYQENALNILKVQSDKTRLNINNITFDKLEQVKGFDATSMTIKFAFKGNYNSIRDFINNINNNREKVALKQISISGLANNLTGNAVITLYGYKNSISEFEKIKNDLPSGKDDLFKVFSGGEEFMPQNESALVEDNSKTSYSSKNLVYDLYMIMNQSSDDAANVIIGKSKNKSSEIFADGNKTNWVNIYFVEKNGKTYYRYRTESGVYPNETDNIEFSSTLKDSILITVFAKDVISVNDKSNVMLNIFNQTNKKVHVNVQGKDGRARVIKNAFSGDVEINYE